MTRRGESEGVGVEAGAEEETVICFRNVDPVRATFLIPYFGREMAGEETNSKFRECLLSMLKD